MIFILFWNFVISSEYYTEINGADTDICHILSPCSFSRMAALAKPKDIIYVNGQTIEEPDDLEQIRDLFMIALSKGAIITSNNMTINGTKFRKSAISFIVVQSTTDSRIDHFHFTGFSCSIACFRTVEKGVISNSYFTNNHIIGGIGMLSFGVGKCKLEECVLSKNTVLNSSLITMFSTHLYLNLTIIERNFVKSTSRQALLFAINSVCEYTNTTIRYNSSPYAPLHQFEFRSCFGFWNCTFEFNKHPETMLCDGTCEFNFTNTTISNNMGSFLTTSIRSIVSFNESTIIHNYSGNRPLFYLPGSSFYIYHPCSFVENHGFSLIDTTGLKSIINISKGIFRRNKVLNYMIGVDDGSKIELMNTKFSDNISPSGLIYSKKSITIISNSTFSRNRDKAIKLIKGKSYLTNVKLIDNSGIGASSIELKSGFLSIKNSFFKGESINGHINSTGKSALKLSKIDFAGNKQYSLNSALRTICLFCTYNAVRQTQHYWAYWAVFILFTSILSIIVLYCVKLLICMIKKKRNRNFVNSDFL